MYKVFGFRYSNHILILASGQLMMVMRVHRQFMAIPFMYGNLRHAP